MLIICNHWCCRRFHVSILSEQIHKSLSLPSYYFKVHFRCGITGKNEMGSAMCGTSTFVCFARYLHWKGWKCYLTTCTADSIVTASCRPSQMCSHLLAILTSLDVLPIAWCFVPEFFNEHQLRNSGSESQHWPSCSVEVQGKVYVPCIYETKTRLC